MTSLATLTQLVPPPAHPTPTDWNAVETFLQAPLPTDYKQLVDTYGPGSFCDFLHLSTPHRNKEAVDLTGPMPARLRGQLAKDLDSGKHPVPHRPEDLFAIGVTDNGNHLFWITTPEKQPDAWTVTVDEADGHTWHTHDGNLTSFLVALLSGHEHPRSSPTTSSATARSSPPRLRPPPPPRPRPARAVRAPVLPPSGNGPEPRATTYPTADASQPPSSRHGNKPTESGTRITLPYPSPFNARPTSSRRNGREQMLLRLPRPGDGRPHRTRHPDDVCTVLSNAPTRSGK
ncbi:SMI1/KNR4 family protein [Streptomyces hydrogenans]